MCRIQSKYLQPKGWEQNQALHIHAICNFGVFIKLPGLKCHAHMPEMPKSISYAIALGLVTSVMHFFKE